MALYGPNTPAGFIPFTGYSPTLGAGDAVTGTTSGLVQFNGMTQFDEVINHLLKSRQGLVARKLLQTLIGIVPGSTATQNVSRVAGIQAFSAPGPYGGLVAIESVALINRATTATDVTNLNGILLQSDAPATYATDVSGNGGGGRGGY